MASSAFGSLISIESVDTQVRTPEKSKSINQGISREDFGPAINVEDVEMYPIPLSTTSSRPPGRIETADDARRGSSDENGTEQRQGPISEQVQTIWNPYKNRFRVMAACMTTLGNGMNDSAPGALIASIERLVKFVQFHIWLTSCSHYRIAYGTVSIIFLCNALGFLAAALFISPLSSRVGRAKSLMISEALLILGYTIIVTTPPFPVVCLSYVPLLSASTQFDL